MIDVCLQCRAIVEALELMQREVLTACDCAAMSHCGSSPLTLPQHMAALSQCTQGSGSGGLMSQVGSRAVALTQGGHRCRLRPLR